MGQQALEASEKLFSRVKNAAGSLPRVATESGLPQQALEASEKLFSKVKQGPKLAARLVQSAPHLAESARQLVSEQNLVWGQGESSGNGTTLSFFHFPSLSFTQYFSLPVLLAPRLGVMGQIGSAGGRGGG